MKYLVSLLKVDIGMLDLLLQEGGHDKSHETRRKDPLCQAFLEVILEQAKN
jgi:hypothetical protein